MLLDLARPNLVPTRLDNLTENLLWAADGSEVDTVVAPAGCSSWTAGCCRSRTAPGPRTVMAQVQALSEWFADYRAGAPEVRGTGAHA